MHDIRLSNQDRMQGCGIVTAADKAGDHHSTVLQALLECARLAEVIRV